MSGGVSFGITQLMSAEPCGSEAGMSRLIELAREKRSAVLCVEVIYQLSMVEQVREAMEKANERVYGVRVTVH